MSEGQELRDRVARIDGLVQELELTADPVSRAAAKELVHSLMDLHGGAIQRILNIVSKAGDAGSRIIEALGADELVSSLLVLYDLHPDDFETRVRRALERAHKFASPRGAHIEAVAIAAGTVHVRIAAMGHSCGSTARDVESFIREALFETAPDANDVVIDGAEDQPASGFVPLATLQPPNGTAAHCVTSSS